MKKYVFLLCTLFFAVSAAAQPARIDLNGVWEYGLDRKYTASTHVPGVPLDATRPCDGTLWYRRTVTLPAGDWSSATLELKGARFRPEVYIDGDKVSSQHGGMIRSLHELRHPSLRPGGSVTLEIALASLANVPAEDASFIPKVDQWRSNCSSSLWDDVVLHLDKGARTDRVLTFCSPTDKRATLRYRVRGGAARTARLAISRHGKELLSLQGPANEGENEVSFDYKGLLEEWSPERPELYELRVELLGADAEIISVWQQSLGLRDMKTQGKQFALNGQPLKLRGGTVVWHRWMRDKEGREVGYDTTWFRDNIVLRLKEHGANLLRFHLGVPPERLLDLCDRYGLAVQYEWNFFHGMPASRESLMEQYPKWFDLAARHPSVLLFHPYNETEGEQLETAWNALDQITPAYPGMVLEDRDVIHIHKYWWSLFENLGLYYDTHEQFPKAIMVDEFGGNYLDGNGDMGGYPAIRESYLRFLGRNHTAQQRLRHLDRSNAKVAEYWRRIGAAGVAPFTIASSYADGNTWFLGELRDGHPKNVWNALTVLWSPQAVSMDIWNSNFTPGQRIALPLHFFNDTDRRSTLRARVEITDAFARRSLSKYVECRVEAFDKQVINCLVELPDVCGDYILRATLENPTPEVKYPVVSEWDIRVLQTQVPEKVARAAIYIPAEETELQAMARQLKLHTVDKASGADVLLLGRHSWERLPSYSRQIETALTKGAGVVMLDIGERYLGQGYPADSGELGPLQGVARITTPKVTHYELFSGLTLTFTEAAEPESHLHPDVEHAELWRGLKPQHTALWNGLRGGLIVPAADMQVQGLSRDALTAQWSRRGADPERMKQGGYFAYELCGFYAFDPQPDNKEVIRDLRRKIEFLVEDAPALATSINPKTPVVVTDLGAAYRNAETGRAWELTPLSTAGKNLTRIPVVKVGFGPGKGNLVLSQLLTAGRLDAEAPAPTAPYVILYDEAALNMVINMINNVLNGNTPNQK